MQDCRLKLDVGKPFEAFRRTNTTKDAYGEKTIFVEITTHGFVDVKTLYRLQMLDSFFVKLNERDVKR
jgi:hypothetical protein